MFYKNLLIAKTLINKSFRPQLRNSHSSHGAPNFLSQLVLPENFDPLLNHFVYFQEPKITKNVQSNDESVIAARKENTDHTHFNQILPTVLYNPSTSYGAYFKEPEKYKEKFVFHASTDNISQMYKKRRICKRYDTETKQVLSSDC